MNTVAASSTSPWLQAARLVFMVFYAFTLLAATRWALANVRQVNAGERAVVLRMGALQRVHAAGLLWAWPQPLEQVVMIPAAEAVLQRHVQNLLRSAQAMQADAMAYDDDQGGPVSDALAGSGYLLTGDAGIAQLDVRVFYRIVDALSYVLQGEHVLPALDRIVTRSAVALCAGRDLDTILVARPELVNAHAQDAAHGALQRQRLRGDLQQAINRRLLALQQQGAGLGIEVTRVDVQSSLPRDTLNAFNAVLTATQQAEKNIADARTEAARIMQVATQSADRSVQVASAQASERLAKAQADTATVWSLAQTLNNRAEPGLLLRVYRERMPAILAKAGSITVSTGDAHLIVAAGQANDANKRAE